VTNQGFKIWLNSNKWVVKISTSWWSMGVCTLRWLIFSGYSTLKSPYDNVKMVVYFDIINLVGNYMVVNKLKSPYEEYSF